VRPAVPRTRSLAPALLGTDRPASRARTTRTADGTRTAGRTRANGTARTAGNTGTAVFLLDLAGSPTDGDAILLGEDEVARARRFLRDVDLDRFVLRRALTRLLLAAELGCAAAEIAFEVEPCGRPRIARPATDLAFSLASSERLGLLALGTDPLGVDIERVRKELASPTAAEQFLTEDELARWHGLDDVDRIQAFFTCWTRKEAAAKAFGLGLGGLAPRTQELGFAVVPGLSTFEPAPGYVAALADGVAIPARTVSAGAGSAQR
jgi:4'-phosphopantetheinyl transferase